MSEQGNHSAQNEQDHEQWLPVFGYEGIYDVSSFGRIRRIKRSCGAVCGRILKPHGTSKNLAYLAVTLYRSRQARQVYVHAVVAEAFHGRRPSGKVTNHKDADKRNNRSDNLEWVTYQENARHACALGLMVYNPARGQLHGAAKLTDQQVMEIRSLKGIVGARSLAKRFCVSRSLVQFIHQGKVWRHLDAQESHSQDNRGR